MSSAITLEDLDEAAVARLAELIALKVQPGDTIALNGNLGAGKTTFARALIRALLQDADAEVPSPTFPILQPYDTDRIAIAHFDLYRIGSVEDLDELGFDDAIAGGLVIIEWPERAEDALPCDRLEITFNAGLTNTRRDLTLLGVGTFGPKLERLAAIHGFLQTAPGSTKVQSIAYLQGDASQRTYARIATGTGSFILMDSPRMADGPPVRDGLPYSRIAHLAEDVRPFVAIAAALEASGLSVPHVYSADLEQGLLLLEDLGDQTFHRALRDGVAQAHLWPAAVDVLVALRSQPIPHHLPLHDGIQHALPRFDRAALEIELALLLDWYWPEVKGGPPSDSVRRTFLDLWTPALDFLMAVPAGIFLRDFHSPNLFWLPDRPGIRNVGVIDFQDALAGPWALDLVSLLQDARVDVPEHLEAGELERYIGLIAAREAGFDAERFRKTYAIFGAQRNTRLIGLWVRLLRRDAKPGYLQHMARTWHYLARNLRHPELAALKAWYDEHFPEDVRLQPIVA
ncbi:MAG: tRNA (adenosine(37)-N6)-threonylcarbamoyltransferase complex ATPase subunit type 1 TsaE [Hyphomicrobiaceae bacterium]